MLSSIIRRSVTRTTLHRFYVSLAGNNYTLATKQRRSKDSVVQSITLNHNAIRHYFSWDNKNDLSKFLPLLPGYIYKTRTVMSTLSMLFTEYVTLRPLIDPEFRIMSLVETMKNVACKISMELINQNYDSLIGLVEDDALQSLQEKIEPLSQAQRNLLAIQEENVAEYTPGYIKIVGKSLSGDRKSFNVSVEMNVIIYYEPLYGQIRYKGEEDSTPDNLRIPPLLIANYLFVRDYTQDGGSDWTIAYINVDTPNIFSGL